MSIASVSASAAAQQPAAANSGNRPAGPSPVNRFQLAYLLSSQGATIMSPDLQIHPGHSGSQTLANPFAPPTNVPGALPPATAAEEAAQIMQDFGSHGVLTLSDVESAENGCASAPADDLMNSNTDADIAADFTQLSGGGTTMTLAQLTSAIKTYADPENPHPNTYGKALLPGGQTPVSTTNHRVNSSSAAAKSSSARMAAEQYLSNEQTVAETANPRRATPRDAERST